MKLIKLLSRYLSGGRPLRSRRNRTPFEQSASALTQTDVDLERRLLLSGIAVSPPDSASLAAENAAGPLKIASATYDAFDGLRISLDDGADLYVKSGFAVLAKPSEGATGQYVVISVASAADTEAVDHYRFELGDASHQLLQVNYGHVAAAEDEAKGEIIADGAVSHSNGQAIDLDQRQPISKDLLAELLTPKPEEPSLTEKSSTTPAASRPVIATSSGSAASRLADDVSGEIVSDATDLFFSAADTPLWNVDANDLQLPLPDSTSTTSRSKQSQLATTAIESADRQDPEQSQSLGDAAVRARKQPSRSPGRRTDVFTTSESRTAFARLLNSLVQFDTAEFLDPESKLTDWLSEQFDLGAEDNGSEDLELASTNTAYADTTETADREQRIERLQQAYLKIDSLLASVAALTVLSDHSPIPPEIAGIWQRICFECNPRGPPVSDQISGSDFDQVEAGRIQLQQLRYSISPRGPSVVSVN